MPRSIILLLVFLISGMSLLTHAAEAPAAAESQQLAPTRSRWLDFDVFGVYADQANGGGSSRSFGIAWRPELWGEGEWKLFGQLGAGMVYAKHKTFPAPTLTVRMAAARQLDNFYAALGGGSETWFGFGGTAPALEAELGYLLSGAHFTRLYVSYTSVFFSLYTSEVCLGVGLNF